MLCDIAFVCQAGELELQTMLLAQSIRLFGGQMAAAPLHAIIPIPETVYGVLDPATLSFLATLGVQRYRFPNPISDRYWYANKLNAFKIAPQTANIMFLDTDVVVLDDCSDALAHNAVDILVRPALSTWPPRKFDEALWGELYGEFRLSAPTRRVRSAGRKQYGWNTVDGRGARPRGRQRPRRVAQQVASAAALKLARLAAWFIHPPRAYPRTSRLAALAG